MTDHRARASAHAKRLYYCECGKVVRGNGGRAMHFGTRHGTMAQQVRYNERRAAGHRLISSEQWDARFGPDGLAGALARVNEGKPWP